MHVIQTLTLIHDRHTSASPFSRRTTTEIYHWSQAVALFNRKLSLPVQPHDRDPLWATASLLGTIALSSIDTSNPEEIWPLRQSDPSDLEWLRLNNGKKVMWGITNPTRADSIFHVLSDVYQGASPPDSSTEPGIEGVPLALIQLYDLDLPSTAASNPYHAAVHTLAPLLQIPCNPSTIPRFFRFPGSMTRAFERLLHQKDPRALLLMAFWYAAVCHSVWWLTRRAWLECYAICIYLERYHANEMTIQELLHFPRLACGLVS